MRRFDRTSPTTLISTVVVLAAMVIALLALLIFAPTSSAGPAEDCAAVRARDHQIYLNLIASLPPGAPIPPEYINPCLTAPSTTATAAPTTTVGLPGAQAPGGGPNVCANAPTNFPTYNGTPIVPVPGAALPGQPNTPTPPGIENPAEVPVPTTTSGPAPTTPQPAGSTAPASTTDRGPGPVPAATPNNAPAPQESTPTATPSGLDEDDGRDRHLELVLVGAAAFTAAGIGVRGRPGPFSARVSARPWESVLSQVVGTIAKPFMPYFVGGQDVVVIPDPGGGQRTIFLIHDETSSHEAQMVVDVPPGGHMSINDDGSVGVYDANGDLQGTVAAAWAYDVNGDPVPTYYEIRDGKLYQVVVPTPGVIYPVLADGPYGGENIATGRPLTATPLPNGQEAISGQPDGVAVVGTPDPGYTAYVPNQDTMKPGSEVTVDQGDGTANRYNNPVDSGDAELEVTTVPTSEALDTMAAAQEDANRESAAAAVQAVNDREELQRQTDEERATRDWLSEMGSGLGSLLRFSQNVTGGNGISGLAEAGSDLLGLGMSVGQGMVSYNRDPSGALTDAGRSLLRIDALEQNGPRYWMRQLQLDAALGVVTGVAGEVGATSRVAAGATRIDTQVAQAAERSQGGPTSQAHGIAEVIDPKTQFAPYEQQGAPTEALARGGTAFRNFGDRIEQSIPGYVNPSQTQTTVGTAPGPFTAIQPIPPSSPGLAPLIPATIFAVDVGQRVARIIFRFLKPKGQ
ncbi:hypothetical protein R3Q06_30420 [Rhodococcus erythropolis]|uniref:hypothetical protein n=1 Tax=Rhodococcus erythropolis TaxID=1833 RepID=UPI00294A735A|nr:hypothetical protein [Rhodococcus erythropolis]MDV6277812.1 hypothetical protein [Rhodococcus erythropolis]